MHLEKVERSLDPKVDPPLLENLNLLGSYQAN